MFDSKRNFQQIRVCIPVGLMLLILIGLMGATITPTAHAQQSTPTPSPIMNEIDYWLTLQQSIQILDLAIDNNDPYFADRELNQLWAHVDQVRLADQSVMDVETDWLDLNPGITTVDDLRILRDRIQAMIDFQASRGGLSSEELLARLGSVMQNFNYNQPAPPPSRPRSRQTSSGGGSLIPSGLMSLILMVVGVIVVILIVMYFLRNLQIQAAALRENQDEDIPTTSAAADELADRAWTQQDYRAAIRYLYLSSLLNLDERGVIDFDPNLTNLEHLRQVADQPRLNDLLGQIVWMFDRVWYGFAPVTEDQYAQFREHVSQLKQFQVRQSVPGSSR